MDLVDKIKGALDLEIRVSSGAHEYFEAVFALKDIQKLIAILEETLGQPLKPAGKDVRFQKEMQKIVDLIGGLRREQSFYVKNEDGNKYLYAALWPWQSNPEKITLKLGIYDTEEVR